MASSAVLVSIVSLLLAQPASVPSRYYDIQAEGLDAADAGRMLDQLHQQLRPFFGKPPENRIPVFVYAARAEFEQALAEEGYSAGDLGGGYSVASGKIYLCLQPSQYYTRHLLLHEATHQFHAANTPSLKLPRAFWYREGIAEYFAMHNWDGQRLRTGVVPAISIEDYPQQALQWLEEGDLQELVADKTECPRPAAWALVHFLLHKHARKFRVLREMLDRNQPPLPAWRKVFGASPRVMRKDLRAWLTGHQQPWQNVWIAWQERGAVLEGRNLKGQALAVLKQTPQRMQVELQPGDGRWQAGLVFGYQSPADFATAQILADGKLWIRRRWQVLAEPFFVDRGPDGDRPVRIELIQAADQVTVKVAGYESPPLEAPGQMGLTVGEGCVQFQVQIERDTAAAR